MYSQFQLLTVMRTCDTWSTTAYAIEKSKRLSVLQGTGLCLCQPVNLHEIAM